jgi:nucleoside-diphosphate-sugar epimerase
MTHPIVTGAAGRVGGVGGLVVEALQRRGLPVRAMVRREDERAEALSTASAYRFVQLPQARRPIASNGNRADELGEDMGGYWLG